MYNNEKLILSFLKENNRDDLVDKFKTVISMAKTRQEVRMRIGNLSNTIFQHVFLYVFLKKNNISFPTNWVSEIESYFEQIDANNSSKKGKNNKWFTATEILKELNSNIVPKTKTVILRKLMSFSQNIQKKIIKNLDEFFSSDLKLENIGLDIKYINDQLTLLLNGKKI